MEKDLDVEERLVIRIYNTIVNVLVFSSRVQKSSLLPVNV